MTGTATVQETLAADLAGFDTSCVFGLMGEDTAPLVASLSELPGVSYFAMRHEAAAVMAAGGYAWAAGRLGVAVLSRGPGFTNAITAAVTAIKAGWPVLLLAGTAVETGDLRPDLKSVDQAAIASAIGLRYVEVGDAAGARRDLARAAALAQGGRPTLLAIPPSVLRSPAPEQVTTPVPRSPTNDVERTEPSPSEVERLAELLGAAERPLVLAGRGAIAARAELEQLAEQTGALLGTTLQARDLFSGHRLNLGIVGGFAADSVRPLLADVDLVVAFGASLTSWTMAFGTLFADATIVQVDHDADRLGVYRPGVVGIAADAAATARRLNGTLPPRATSSPLHAPEVLELLAQPRYAGDDESAPGAADPRIISTLLDELLPPERVIVTDAGHHFGFPAMYVAGAGPDSYCQTTSYASIGLGLGAGIGATMARPRRPTVLFVGDGGLMNGLGDLETLARYDVPLIVIVMNDGALGAERHSLELGGLPSTQAVFGDVDFAGLARALHIKAVTITSPAELSELAPSFTARTQPFLIDCKVQGEIRVPWLVEVVRARAAAHAAGSP